MRQRFAVWVVPVLSLVVVIVATAVLGDRVPDPMAIHWADRPDGAGSLAFMTGVTVATIVLLGWGFLVGAALTDDALGARWLVAGGTSLSVVMAAIHVWVLWANLDAASWERARPLGLALPGALVVLVLGGWLGWALAPAERRRP